MDSTEQPVAADLQQKPVDAGADDKPVSGPRMGGRRRRSSGSRKNSWLAHVKATMKVHRDKSFKQVLKIAKKTYKKSQSQSQSSQNGGKRRKAKRGGSSSLKQSSEGQFSKQQGGSGMAGKAPFGENAAPVA
jgi:hypothetical protein